MKDLSNLRTRMKDYIRDNYELVKEIATIPINKKGLEILVLSSLVTLSAGCALEIEIEGKYRKGQEMKVKTKGNPNRLEIYPMFSRNPGLKKGMKNKEKKQNPTTGEDEWEVTMDYTVTGDTGTYVAFVLGVAEGLIPIIGIWFNSEEDLTQNYKAISGTNTAPVLYVLDEDGEPHEGIGGNANIEYTLPVKALDDLSFSTTSPMKINYDDGSLDEKLIESTTDYFKHDFKHTWTNAGTYNVLIYVYDGEGKRGEKSFLVQLNP